MIELFKRLRAPL